MIDKADDVLGSVSATKLHHYTVRITVSVRPHDDTQMPVRANAQYNLKAIEDPEPYQQFFAAFEKAMFLTAHNVESASPLLHLKEASLLRRQTISRLHQATQFIGQPDPATVRAALYSSGFAYGSASGIQPSWMKESLIKNGPEIGSSSVSGSGLITALGASKHMITLPGGIALANILLASLFL